MRQVFNVIPYFSPTESERIISIYKKYGTIRKVKKGNVLKEGGESNKLFLVKSGLCVYSVNYLLEKPRALCFILPGCTIGDITCLTNETVNVTSIALRDSEVYVVPPDTLYRHMRENFDLTMEAVRKAIHKEECCLESMLANFTLEHEERLKVFYKAMLHALNVELNTDWVKIPLKLSNEEIGILTHATRVTINRIHLKWQQNNLFRKSDDGRYINIKLLDNIYDWKDYTQFTGEK